MDARDNSPRSPLRIQRPAAKVPAARNRKAGRTGVGMPMALLLGRDLHRVLIVLASLGVLLGAVVAGGYGVHSQMAAANERSIRHYWQLAVATRAELKQGAILFVPIGSNICRRRWIDNDTWTMHDGGEVQCDSAAQWNSTVPETQYDVGIRLDAVRNTFRNRGSGNPE